MVSKWLWPSIGALLGVTVWLAILPQKKSNKPSPTTVHRKKLKFLFIRTNLVIFSYPLMWLRLSPAIFQIHCIHFSRTLNSEITIYNLIVHNIIIKLVVDRVLNFSVLPNSSIAANSLSFRLQTLDEEKIFQ